MQKAEKGTDAKNSARQHLLSTRVPAAQLLRRDGLSSPPRNAGTCVAVHGRDWHRMLHMRFSTSGSMTRVGTACVTEIRASLQINHRFPPADKQSSGHTVRKTSARTRCRYTSVDTSAARRFLPLHQDALCGRSRGGRWARDILNGVRWHRRPGDADR